MARGHCRRLLGASIPVAAQPFFMFANKQLKRVLIFNELTHILSVLPTVFLVLRFVWDMGHSHEGFGIFGNFSETLWPSGWALGQVT